MINFSWRTVFPEVYFAIAVAFLGLFEALSNREDNAPQILVALATATTVGLFRRLPSLGLALVWLVCLAQIILGIQLMLVQVCVVAVIFGTARWGSPATLWMSLLSLPAAVAVFLNTGVLLPFRWSMNFQPLLASAGNYGRPVLAMVGLTLLAAPWLAGLNLRFAGRAKDSQAAMRRAEEDAARARREVEQIREIGRLRDEQTRLARDMHDVVGHSLAVILAQAESGQYLKDDPQKLKQTMTTIATSARRSLKDVREVLTATQDGAVPPATAELEHLIERIRASGREVTFAQSGTPRSLPPDLEMIAFRVVQEMLTNAIRHGRRDEPIQIERNWPTEGTDETLRLMVLNVALSPAAPPAGGHGLAGMRQRLEMVNGQIHTRREQRPEGTVFIATASIPIGGHDRHE